MKLSNPFKLEKLKIKAYSDRRRGRADLIGTFEAMFNPSSLGQEFKIVYGKNQGYNSTSQRVDYARSKSPSMNVKLLLDGTGVDSMGITMPFQKSVSEQQQIVGQIFDTVWGTIPGGGTLTNAAKSVLKAGLSQALKKSQEQSGPHAQAESINEEFVSTCNQLVFAGHITSSDAQDAINGFEAVRR